MLNLSNPNLNKLKFKLSKSLKYNLKVLVNKKHTKHLVSVKTFEKGELLVEENSSVNGIYFLLKGKVKIYNLDSKNKPIIHRLVKSGEIVGFSSLNSLKYYSSAKALDKVEAFFINHKNLKFILKKHSKLNILFLDALILKLQNFEMRQRFLVMFNSTHRVIEAILLIASKFGHPINNEIEIYDCTSRKEISALANTSYENTIRVLSRLKKKNFIKVYGKLIVFNKQVLINRLMENYCLSSNEENLLNNYLSLNY